MATTQIKDLVDGQPSGVGGLQDGEITIDSLLVVEDPSSGKTRKISVRDFLGFLGFNVGTETQIATNQNGGEPKMGFITDGRKFNHVEGSGTFSEGSGAGTGTVAFYQSSTDPESISDGANVQT